MVKQNQNHHKILGSILAVLCEYRKFLMFYSHWMQFLVLFLVNFAVLKYLFCSF